MGEPWAAASAAGGTALWEVLLELDFDTEEPSSPKVSESRGAPSPNTESTSRGIR